MLRPLRESCVSVVKVKAGLKLWQRRKSKEQLSGGNGNTSLGELEVNQLQAGRSFSLARDSQRAPSGASVAANVGQLLKLKLKLKQNNK